MSKLILNRSSGLGSALCLASCLCTVGIACDPGSKSVSGTADEAGDGANDGDSSANDDDNATDGGGATSQGPGDGGDGNFPGEPNCLETATVLANADEVSPLGIAANDAIQGFDGWSMDLAWLPNDGPAQIVPAGTTTQLNIGLTYAGAEIRYIDSEPNPNSPFGGEIGCEDRLEFDIQVNFATVDGRFDEAFTTVATVNADSVLSIGEYFEPDGFSGTFSAAEVSFGDNGGEVTAFAIFATLADGPPTGEVNMEVTLQLGDNPDEGVVGFGVIAAFPGLPE